MPCPREGLEVQHRQDDGERPPGSSAPFQTQLPSEPRTNSRAAEGRDSRQENTEYGGEAPYLRGGRHSLRRARKAIAEDKA